VRRVSSRWRPRHASPEMMIRVATGVAGIFFVVLTVAFYTRAGWATALWPWPDARMSYVFLASIAAAIAAPAIWIAVTGELAAFAPVWLNTSVVHGGFAAYLSSRAIRHDEPRLLAAATVSATLAVGGVALFRRSQRIPIRDPRPMPRVVRGAFVGFSLLLLAVGIPLVLQVPDIFPWTIAPETSTLFGWIFLGPSLFFAYGVFRPLWAFAAGPLWSFLAYDVVLAIPYVRMFGERSDGAGGLYSDFGYGMAGAAASGSDVNETSLAVYLSILGVSAALALYYLFVDEGTRVFSERRRSLRYGV
jgi:hypothetical protein